MKSTKGKYAEGMCRRPCRIREHSYGVRKKSTSADYQVVKHASGKIVVLNVVGSSPTLHPAKEKRKHLIFKGFRFSFMWIVCYANRLNVCWNGEKLGQ